MRQPWTRQPDEPARWHRRFDVFRLLGPTRTIEEAYRACAQLEKLAGERPGANWTQAARAYNWLERAAEWDDDQQAELEAHLAERRNRARSNRIQMVEHLLTLTFNVIRRADLANLDAESAREFLPTLRLLFHSLLAAHRIEYGPVPDIIAAESLAFTADDYLAAQAAFATTGLRDILADLYPEESSARRIAASAGLILSHISFSPIAIDTWHHVIAEAKHAGHLQKLLAIVRTEYPANPFLRALEATHASTNGSP